MTSLQSGTPVCLLAPQSFKNSSKVTQYQSAIRGSVIQQCSSGSYSVNTLKPFTLKVINSGTNSAVLGLYYVQKFKKLAQVENE